MRRSVDLLRALAASAALLVVIVGIPAFLVVAIGWMYLVPQFQGAALALATGAGELQRTAGIPSNVAIFGQAVVILTLILFGSWRARD